MRTLCAFALGCWALMMGWTAPAHAQTAVMVTGTVVDESGGAIAGASVRLTPGAAVRTATTDAAGTFRFDGVAPGAISVEAAREGFVPARADAVAASDAPPLRIVLAVSAVREAITVTGAVTDAVALEAPAGTGSRLPIAVRDMPAAITIVNRAVIEERGATDTQEILKSVPGLTAAAPPGSAGSVSYRGFGTTQITQLFNGITVQYDAIAARPVDAWVYDRVEVIGGPSTFLYGAGAVGGSINYVTKLAEASRNLVNAQLRAGSFGTVEGSIGVNRGFDTGRVAHAVRVDANQSLTDGYVDGAKRSALSSAASWRADLGQRLSHTLAVEYQHEQADRPYWGTPLLNPTAGNGRILDGTRFTNYNSADGIYEQTVGWARSITDLTLGAVRLRNTGYYYDALRDYRNVEVYRFNAANTAVTRSSPLLQRHDQQLKGTRLEASSSGRLAVLETDWAAGLDVSANTQTRFPRSLSSTVSVVAPLAFSTEDFFSIPGMVPGFTPDRTNDVTTVAAFAEHRVRLGSRVSLVTALRGERIQLEGTNRRPATISATNPASFTNTYTPVTGRAGLVVRPAASTSLYAQFSTAADPPAGILTTASFAQVRDFDLTTGQQVEAGAKLDLPHGLGSATAAAFRIVRKNLAIADPLNPGTTMPVGQQSSRGLELALALTPRRGVRAEGNYAYVDATFDDFIENVGGVGVSRRGNAPGNTPAHVANLWITVTPTPRLDVGADGRWVSSRFGNTANTIGDGAYALYSAFATVRVGARGLLTGRLRNLTDAVYAASVTGTPMFFLGAPRSADVTLRVSF
ncbi:MAG: TonB-dependent receptor [Vicinamibacterales bacterium]